MLLENYANPSLEVPVTSYNLIKSPLHNSQQQKINLLDHN